VGQAGLLETSDRCEQNVYCNTLTISDQVFWGERKKKKTFFGARGGSPQKLVSEKKK
jgi:hypothetical protein